MDEGRFEQLHTAYRNCLIEARKERPDLYSWPENEASFVASQMMLAVKTKGIGTVDIGGPAWRKTCRALGLRTTYRALRAYLDGK
jgi:nitroreductase